MSRIGPDIITPISGPTSGQILAAGLSRSIQEVGLGIQELDARLTTTRNNRVAAEWSVRTRTTLNESRVQAEEGQIEDMLGTLRGGRDTLLKEAGQIEDPELRQRVMEDISNQWAANQVVTRRTQSTREAQASIAAGDALRLSFIEDPNMVLSEATKQWLEYTDEQEANVYGENKEAIAREGVVEIAQEKFQTILEISPKAALDFLESNETVKEFLTPGERRDLKNKANAVITSKLSNLEQRSEALSTTDDPDQEAKLKAIGREISRLPASDRQKLALARNKQHQSQAKRQVNQTRRNIVRYGEILAGKIDAPLPNDDKTINGHYQQVKNAGGDISGLIRDIQIAGGRIPPNYITDLQKAGEDDTQNLAFTSSQFRSMSQSSRSEAARIAGTTGAVAETAFYVTARLDEDEAADRQALLANPGVREQLAIADELLTDNPELLIDKLPAETFSLMSFPFAGPPALLPIPITIPPTIFAAPTPTLHPIQSSELKNLYRFHFARLRRGGEQDPETLGKNASIAATQEFRNSHESMVVGRFGSRKTMFIDNNVLESGGRFPAATALSQIQGVTSAMLRDAGPGSDLLVGDPIIQTIRKRSFLPISNLSGIVGYVEWDGATGIARPVTDATDSTLFASLKQQSINMRINPAPRQDLARQSAGQTMTAAQGVGIGDQAIEIFRRNHDNRMPETEAEQASVDKLAHDLATSQYNWDRP